jgi:hypothetical protein
VAANGDATILLRGYQDGRFSHYFCGVSEADWDFVVGNASFVCEPCEPSARGDSTDDSPTVTLLVSRVVRDEERDLGRLDYLERGIKRYDSVAVSVVCDPQVC